MKNGWISIDEKLPPLKTSVLVACYGRVCYGMMESPDGEYGYPVFLICDNLDSLRPVYQETTEHSELTQGRVKAWMELPKPPGEIGAAHELHDLYDARQISVRLYNVLCRGMGRIGEPLTLEDVANYTRKDLMAFRNMGVNAMKELDRLMEAYGLEYAGKEV